MIIERLIDIFRPAKDIKILYPDSLALDKGVLWVDDKEAAKEYEGFPCIAKAYEIYSAEYLQRLGKKLQKLQKEIESIISVPNVQVSKEKAKQVLLGIALGDMYGCPYEGISDVKDPSKFKAHNIPSPGRITDDTVMSLATYEAVGIIKSEGLKEKEAIQAFEKAYKTYAKRYPHAGYGGAFFNWAVMGIENDEYMSFGDGSAMRAGIIGVLSDSLKECIYLSALSALPTHAHPEGIKGAIAAAVLTYLAARGASKEDIRKVSLIIYPNGAHTAGQYRSGHYEYISPDLTMQEIWDNQMISCSVLCQVTVPISIALFLQSENFEEFIKLITFLPLDADTAGAIGGSIAGAYYDKLLDELPYEKIEEQCKSFMQLLPEDIYAED